MRRRKVSELEELFLDITKDLKKSFGKNRIERLSYNLYVYHFLNCNIPFNVKLSVDDKKLTMEIWNKKDNKTLECKNIKHADKFKEDYAEVINEFLNKKKRW